MAVGDGCEWLLLQAFDGELRGPAHCRAMVSSGGQHMCRAMVSSGGQHMCRAGLERCQAGGLAGEGCEWPPGGCRICRAPPASACPPTRPSRLLCHRDPPIHPLCCCRQGGPAAGRRRAGGTGCPQAGGRQPGGGGGGGQQAGPELSPSVPQRPPAAGTSSPTQLPPTWHHPYAHARSRALIPSSLHPAYTLHQYHPVPHLIPLPPSTPLNAPAPSTILPESLPPPCVQSPSPD